MPNFVTYDFRQLDSYIMQPIDTNSNLFPFYWKRNTNLNTKQNDSSCANIQFRVSVMLTIDYNSKSLLYS